jgi:hypothetical protein
VGIVGQTCFSGALLEYQSSTACIIRASTPNRWAVNSEAVHFAELMSKNGGQIMSQIMAAVGQRILAPADREVELKRLIEDYVQNDVDAAKMRRAGEEAICLKGEVKECRTMSEIWLLNNA